MGRDRDDPSRHENNGLFVFSIPEFCTARLAGRNEGDSGGLLCSSPQFAIPYLARLESTTVIDLVRCSRMNVMDSRSF
jgi:hypothetical protein